MDFTSGLIQFDKDLPAIIALVLYVFAGVGALLVVHAIWLWIKRSSEKERISSSKPWNYLLIGAILVQLSSFAAMVAETASGSTYGTEFALTTFSSTANAFQQSIRACIHVAQFFGLVGIGKGLLQMLGMSNEQSASMNQNPAMQGFWHAAFGGLAVNMVAVLQSLAGYFNWPFPAWLS